jgi:hypothetical protein
MLFRVSGKFADGFTFSINPVDAEGPREALAGVMENDSVTKAVETHGAVIVCVVRQLGGENSKVRISTEASKPRKGGGRKKKDAPAAETPAPAPAPAPVAAAGQRRNR